MLVDKPRDAYTYFPEATKSLMESHGMKVLERQLSPCFGKPENQFSHAVSELSLLSDPYKVLVIPYTLPLLQHIVCLLRPYRINLHAWA